MQAFSAPKLDGTGPTYATPTTSDTAPVGTVLIVKNGAGASITATLTAPKTLETGDAYPAKVHTIGAGAEKWIPVLKVYGDPTTQLATITYSSVTSITAAVVMFTAV